MQPEPPIQRAAEVDTRNAKDCRERWIYQLNPEINKSKFTAEEDAHLVALSESDLPRGPRGTDWWSVARALPGPGGRTDMAVKNRYNALKKRKRPAARMVL